MRDPERVRDVAETIAAAIERRDVAMLRSLLAPGFVHRSHGGAASDADTFLRAIADIPGDIRFVRLESTVVDVLPGGAMLTGTQHAQVLIDGQVVDDRRGFVDWFVKVDDAWRIQAAVDLPSGS